MLLPPHINAGASGKYSPSVSPDGQKLYYVDDSREGYFWDIWVSTWDSSISDWRIPQNLDWPVNTPGAELSARIGPDGRHLYFNSESDSVDSLNPTGRCGIYVSEWNDTSWSIPVKISVSQCAIDEYPSLTANGRWLYFHRYVSDGISIFVSEKSDSMWGPPVDLRSQIGERAFTPFIVPSGESLFLATSRLGGLGGTDIFVMNLISLKVEEGADVRLPRSFELYQNYPNPFNSQTRISFFVSRIVSEPVNLTVFNLLGFPVRRLVEYEYLKGNREVEWDGTDDNGKEVSSGIYLIRLKVGSQSEVKKAVYLK